MKTYVTIGLVLLALLILILLKEYMDSKRRLKKAMIKIREAFGHTSDKRLSPDEFISVKKLFYRYMNDGSIDDITANDIDLDTIFQKFDVSLSSPGRDFFYFRLRSPIYDEKERVDFCLKSEYLSKNREETDRLRAGFYKIGKLFKVSFFDCLDYFDTITVKPMFKEYLAIALIVIGIGLLFVDTPFRVVFLIAALVYNIIDYYKERGEIEPYVITLAYIVNFVKISHEIGKGKIDILSDEFDELAKACDDVKQITRFSSIVTAKNNSTGAGNPLDILADYMRMLLHLDIIRFYKIVGLVGKNREKIESLYILLGKIETYATAASVRLAYPEHCIAEAGVGINAVNIYHPLIEKPVKNSIKAEGGVLITGSNASGKSTFLKTVALNCVFARTIGIAFADSFSMDNFHIFSSMSLSDDLLGKNSYFMVEIKALKRIFDYKDANPDARIICFVDEVLRGTNTVERIAACTQILRNMNESGVLCFAATHDIELTELLQDDYSNYHFDEEIIEDDVLFNYKLKDGKATSKNAIKLLSIMGFSKNIVDKARDMADDFTENGIWRG